MINEFLVIWLAALPLMGSPGPATLSLAAMGTAYGFERGRSYLVGIILGTTAVLLLIAAGITTVILAEPALVTALTILATVYILYLAWKIATAPVGAQRVSSGYAPALLPGFILALANPKAFAAIGAVFASQTIFPDDLTADAAAKILALTCVIVVVNTAWLLFGSVFSQLLSHPRLGRMVNIAFAFLLVLSVGMALKSI
jgi:threonine/homoserine/homoserine lactone efflux protein